MDVTPRQRLRVTSLAVLMSLAISISGAALSETTESESLSAMNSAETLNHIKIKFQHSPKSCKLDPLPGAISKEYDLLHPYYVKFCATSRFHPKEGKGIVGGSAGHAVFYLKGVCKDLEGPPSQLKLCDEGANYKNPNLGVGLSVNRGLKNANFFAVPGLALFLAGEMDFKKTFDESVRDAMIQEAIAGGMLDKIQFHDFAFELRGKKMDQQTFVASEIFGTDFALNMARNLYCINVPVTRTMMGEVVASMNALNDRYRKSKGMPYRGIFASGTKDDDAYHWSGIYDNCTHTINNAFAEFGLLRKKGINLGFFQQLFNLAVPANTFLRIHEQSNLEEIDVDLFYQDPLKRHVFLTYRWIPQQHGALAEFIPTYTNNLVYKPDDTMFIQPHLFENRYRLLKHAVSDPNFSYQSKGYEGFIPNLVYFDEKYTRALDRVKERKKSALYLDAITLGDASKIHSLEVDIRSKEIEQMTTLKGSKSWRQLAAGIGALKVELEKRKEASTYTSFVDKFEAFLAYEIERVESTVVSFYKLAKKARKSLAR